MAKRRGGRSRRPREECHHCGERLHLHSRRPSEGTGILVFLVGLLLAPVLIGIPLIVGGIMKMAEKVYWRGCHDCGAKKSGRGSL